MNNWCGQGRVCRKTVKAGVKRSDDGAKETHWASFSMSVYDPRRRSGDFIPCFATGKTAELFKEYVNEGDVIGVTGKLQMSQWTTDDGQKRSRLQVFVRELDFDASAARGDGVGEGDSADEPKY